ncbi:LacI family DNA-binding transcriptional regulator [Oribacterium sp. WCC10]|uniref:LacI family DNA-binding transcriptional regulator n=1 Tax=Oribacterium sp. WCC10 TaxID=1855343 RepID=UPI0008F2A99A|nr:LacI family DNA-binding transcriptional regulator [Oribacterium sp. WCC10]SFG43232.1 transcriptional regulator, LacI family [Oribacterium sp. WCC10]
MYDNKKSYTIEEIAEICGVSKATVSRVINNNPKGVGEKTRAMVMETIEKLNYRPNTLARSIATSRSGMIGLVVPDVANFFYPKVIRGVTDYYMTQNGYTVLLGNSDYHPETEAAQLMRMVDKRVDGIILCSGVSNIKFLRDFRKYNIPLALMGRSFDSSLSDVSITGDNEIGGYKSAKFLLDGGNQRIAYVEGHTDISGSIQRLKGYKRALKEAEIPFDDALTLHGDYTIDYGKSAADELLDSKVNFDAVMTGSDLIAIGMVAEFERRGVRIPEDIEVIGYDNIELSKVFNPALTTMSKPHYDMAQHISAQILNVIEGRRVMLPHMVVEPTLVIRETTKSHRK